jgi:hypothetical protein
MDLPIIEASLGSFMGGEEEGEGGARSGHREGEDRDVGIVPGIHHSSLGKC